jgi:hypothetical protein
MLNQMVLAKLIQKTFRQAEGPSYAMQVAKCIRVLSPALLEPTEITKIIFLYLIF